MYVPSPSQSGISASVETIWDENEELRTGRARFASRGYLPIYVAVLMRRAFNMIGALST